MKFFAIGDRETVLGFRLVGVEGRVVTGREEALAALEEVVAMKDAGVILMTEQVAGTIREEVEKRLYGFGFPLLLEIPDSSGPDPERKQLEDVVRSAVGISI